MRLRPDMNKEERRAVAAYQRGQWLLRHALAKAQLRRRMEPTRWVPDREQYYDEDYDPVTGQSKRMRYK